MPQEVRFLSAAQLLLTTLVVKIAVVATLATMLVRFRKFRNILLTEQRAWRERLIFAGALGVPLACGVSARLLLNYNAADVSLAGPFLCGLLAGPYAGAIVGVLVGTPALIAGEWVMPFAVGCGFAGGGLRAVCPTEAIWHFSPLFFIDLHRRAWRMIRFKLDWLVVLLAAPIGLELIRQGLGRRFGEHIFHLAPLTLAQWPLVVLATVLSVAIPIKIWNTARIEHRLQEQEKLLMAARLEALKNQINPHFLFNTLTSISSLIRSEPEKARTVIVKLSGLLRRLLGRQEQFVTLEEELASIDEFLDIEIVRFGPTLVVEKDIEPATLGCIVPSMLLQPLVENAIQHGIGQQVGGGRITIRSRRANGHTRIEIADDGTGMHDPQLDPRQSLGIGLRNVDARLRGIYGENYRLRIDSTSGQGTCARIDIPGPARPQTASA